MLKSLVEERKPAYLALCGDSDRKLLRRRKLYSGYKANRPGGAPDFAPQLRRTKQIIRALGLPYFEADGSEADDLIATLATRCVSDEVHIRIVSRDKDLFCLMSDDRIRIYDPIDSCDVDPRYVQKRFGVRCEQMTDYLSLVGDSADGVPGAKGLGPKTVSKLLGEYHSLQGILDNHKHLSPRLKKLTDPTLQPIELSNKLIQLDKSVPIRATGLEFNGLDLRKASSLFQLLGFKFGSTPDKSKSWR